MSDTAITIRMAEEADAKPLLPYTHLMEKRQPSPLNMRCRLSWNLKTASHPP